MTALPLRTDRLVVREMEAADRAALLEFVAEPEQLRWMSIGFPDAASVDAFMAEAERRGPDAERQDWHLAAVMADGGEFVGCVDLMREPGHPYAAELGYFLLRRHWGRGYAQEACRALLDFGFDGLGLHRIWGKCHVQNLASAGVMAGIGMRREGTLREHLWQRDHYRSSHLYALLAGDRAGGGEAW